MPTASGHTTAIRASRVLGTAIFDKSDAKIGKVEDVILDKTGERIMFAVIGRDGALTATENYYPVPWSVLDYDENREAYVVPFTSDALADAPAVSQIFSLTANDGADFHERVAGYYKALA